MDERLRQVPLFDGLSDDQLGELVSEADDISIEPGKVYFTEGDAAAYWWVLVNGALELSRHVGREDVVLGHMDAPGRWAGGMQAWDPHGTYLATGRGAQPGSVLRVPATVLRDLITRWFPLGMHLIGGLYGTARSIESSARQRESLVTLGTLAAGLAHELNNPAAAATRGVAAMEDACASLVGSIQGLADHGLDSERFRALDVLRAELAMPPGTASSLDLADREDALLDWLDAHAVDRGWDLAPTLAAVGADPAWCDRMLDLVGGDSLRSGLGWVAGMLSMRSVLVEVRDATHRISELVSSVRSYTQMDRASAQRLLVTDGIESTLVMLGHKLGPGVEVVREYDPDLPEVEGFPGELNQVWTNLLDNAIDAVAGEGRLRIQAYGDPDSVVVEVRDTGQGMTDEVAARAFDAFFTTKEVGKGSGLGLDIARRIVVERHSGSIDVDREDDETVMRVRLPR